MSGSYIALSSKYNSLLALLERGGSGISTLAKVLLAGNFASTDIDMAGYSLLDAGEVEATNIRANGSTGRAGQVLTNDGTKLVWADTSFVLTTVPIQTIIAQPVGIPVTIGGTAYILPLYVNVS